MDVELTFLVESSFKANTSEILVEGVSVSTVTKEGSPVMFVERSNELLTVWIPLSGVS